MHPLLQHFAVSLDCFLIHDTRESGVGGLEGGSLEGGGAGGGDFNANGMTGGSGIVILRTTKASATLGSGITVNSTAGPGSVNGVSIGGTSDYYYSATSGSGTITFS